MNRLFESHIRRILDNHRPWTLLEIGVLHGANTLKLLEWCAENDAHLTSLDPVRWEGDLPDEIKQPTPGYVFKRGQERQEHFLVPQYLEEVYRRGLQRHWTCLKMRSLDYLDSPDFNGFDAYLIDGDHNYYTVWNELQSIHRQSKPGDILLHHDVIWRWAHRDQYCDPEFIPAEYIGGAKQGVLTAIEDFLDSLSKRKLFRWRIGCPYRFKIVCWRKYGLGKLVRM